MEDEGREEGRTFENCARHSRGNGKRSFPHRCMMKMSKTIALAKVQEIDKISDDPFPFQTPLPAVPFPSMLQSAA